jgi:predicted DNA-binding ribbon-helix-helix protein
MLTQEMVNLKNKNLAQLYNQDFYLWLETTANLLKNRQLDQLDYDNLIEEIETMGRSEKRGLSSNLKVILMHLLKWKYQQEKHCNSWHFTIIEHRHRVEEILEESPSLKVYIPEIITQCYQKARKEASVETGLSINTFPVDCIFSQEEVLDLDFLPD